MTRLLLCTATLLALTASASAQSPGPGWIPTGEWQCGPHVRIISSTDGLGAVNFEIKGAWFDNNYTLRRGQLYYNGVPCAALGDPWAWMKEPRRQTSNLTCDATCQQCAKLRAEDSEFAEDCNLSARECDKDSTKACVGKPRVGKP
jgi:hypothetical protein